MLKTVKDWNNSGCNPFDSMTDYGVRHHKCEHKYVLAIPETPYIKSIKGPLTAHPFVDVERLRTPVNGFLFDIKEYSKYQNGLIDTYNFGTVKYQNYVPGNVFKDNHYYNVSCVAENYSGISNVSNIYPVNLLHGGEQKHQKIICGGILICDIPILCG